MITKKAMQKLKKGQRIVFKDGVLGTVTDANKYCVAVNWDDGEVGYLSVEDGDCVSICEAKAHKGDNNDNEA